MSDAQSTHLLYEMVGNSQVECDQRSIKKDTMMSANDSVKSEL